MKKVLAITQCYPCGSWLCIEKILEKLAVDDYWIQVIGLGKPSARLAKIKYFDIPFFAYTKYGNIAGYSPILGYLWYLPLYFWSFIYSLFSRFDVIIYNGLTSGLVLSPLFKLLGKKNIIMYHSVVGHESARTKRILRCLFQSVDLVVVNSTGSRDDLAKVVDKNKLLVNEHYADEIFFQAKLKKKISHTTLNIFYAGRIDEDKKCFPLIDFAEKFGDDSRFSFIFVGAGTKVEKVIDLQKKFSNIKYGGYVGAKNQLAKLYCQADVVWGFADTTYLGLPAVEALACDTPVVIPKYASIAGKDELIETTLVPESIGWLVDPRDQNNVEQTLLKIQVNHEYLGKKSREYAAKHYSSENLIETVTKIREEIYSK